MEALIEGHPIDEIASRFQALTSLIPLRPLRSAGDYDTAVAVLNQLLDVGAAEQDHDLADLVGILGTLIGDYDDAHHPAETVSPVAMLRFLMEQHRLSQSDLPEIGSQGVVSEILAGKRELNTRQIKALSARFDIPARVFL
jgi:HTH-type transcriptional regulator/antitoxin HigA